MSSHVLLLNHQNHYGRALLTETQKDIATGKPFNLFFNLDTMIGNLETTDDNITNYQTYHSIQRDPEYLEFLQRLIGTLMTQCSRDTIVEVGCNNGDLLRLLGKQSNKLLGIDPCTEDTQESQIIFLKAFFTKQLAENLRKKWENPAVIVARHVLEHITDLNDFLLAINALAGKDTKLIIEVPDFADNLASGDVSPIFCEHVNYFTLPGLAKLFAKADWFIEKHWKIQYWGGSLIVQLSRQNKSTSLKVSAESIASLVPHFNKRVQQQNEALKSAIMSRREVHGKGIMCYGIGNRALHLFAFANWLEWIDTFVDSNPQKAGMFIPYGKSKVESFDRMKGRLGEFHTVLVSGFGYEEQIIKDLKPHFDDGFTQFLCMDPFLRYLI